jgi:hypothetical protein
MGPTVGRNRPYVARLSGLRSLTLTTVTVRLQGPTVTAQSGVGGCCDVVKALLRNRPPPSVKFRQRSGAGTTDR